MPGMMPPTMLPGYGMGHGMEREHGAQMHRSQSMPPGSYPHRGPHVHSGGRFEDAPRAAPPLLGWKTGRNDPTLMHNEVLKMRLGRDRSEMEPRQAAQFINHVRQLRSECRPLASALVTLLCLLGAAPRGSGQFGTPRARPAHWAQSHGRGCSSEPPPKPPLPTAL